MYHPGMKTSVLKNMVMILGDFCVLLWTSPYGRLHEVLKKTPYAAFNIYIKSMGGVIRKGTLCCPNADEIPVRHYSIPWSIPSTLQKFWIVMKRQFWGTVSLEFKGATTLPNNVGNALELQGSDSTHIIFHWLQDIKAKVNHPRVSVPPPPPMLGPLLFWYKNHLHQFRHCDSLSQWGRACSQ